MNGWQCERCGGFTPYGDERLPVSEPFYDVEIEEVPDGAFQRSRLMSDEQRSSQEAVQSFEEWWKSMFPESLPDIRNLEHPDKWAKELTRNAYNSAAAAAFKLTAKKPDESERAFEEANDASMVEEGLLPRRSFDQWYEYFRGTSGYLRDEKFRCHDAWDAALRYHSKLSQRAPTSPGQSFEEWWEVNKQSGGGWTDGQLKIAALAAWNAALNSRPELPQRAHKQSFDEWWKVNGYLPDQTERVSAKALAQAAWEAGGGDDGSTARLCRLVIDHVEGTHQCGICGGELDEPGDDVKVSSYRHTLGCPAPLALEILNAREVADG